MQDDYKKKIEDLSSQYDEQKQQIAETRKMTEEYEKKNEKLNEEIRALKAKKGA